MLETDCLNWCHFIFIWWNQSELLSSCVYFERHRIDSGGSSALRSGLSTKARQEGTDVVHCWAAAGTVCSGVYVHEAQHSLTCRLTAPVCVSSHRWCRLSLHRTTTLMLRRYRNWQKWRGWAGESYRSGMIERFPLWCDNMHCSSFLFFVGLEIKPLESKEFQELVMATHLTVWQLLWSYYSSYKGSF